MTSLLDMLADPGPDARITGVVTAVVTNVEDPEGLHRVKLRFPWLSDDEESFWARVATPMAGKDRGLYLLPEVDDEVLVAFEHGDPRFPYVVGSLWNKNAKPPAESTQKNDKRSLTSRSGHVIRLDDTEGAEKIEIVDKSEKNSVVISTSDNTITITADADITIKSADGKLVLEGKGGVEILSEADVKVEAKGEMTLKAGGQLTAKGSVINLN
jgi:phage baseplate assembly protein V